MSDDSPVQFEEQVFRPQWYRLALPCAAALAAVAFLVYRLPAGLWVALPLISFALAIGAFLNSGVILSREGIAWFALRPRWRFRFIPWRAVREVKRNFFGLGKRILIVAAAGRYELWVWGRLRRGGELTFEIWTRVLADGNELWDAIHRWRALAEPDAGPVEDDDEDAVW